LPIHALARLPPVLQRREGEFILLRQPRTDVRYFNNFVRFTPESGHFSGLMFRPLLTQSGHFLRCI